MGVKYIYFTVSAQTVIDIRNSRYKFVPTKISSEHVFKYFLLKKMPHRSLLKWSYYTFLH